MAKLNVPRKAEKVFTFEGGKASSGISSFEKLKRSILSCMLWENTFYEDGIKITDRIASYIPSVKKDDLSNLVLSARNEYKLRHAPLFLINEMAKSNIHKEDLSELIYDVVQRPDEMAELLAIYWEVSIKNDKVAMNKKPISAQIKKGLAKAFTKFDEYQLAKYNRDGVIKLRDILFLCHAKPKTHTQAFLWKKLIGGVCENTLEKLDKCKCKHCRELKLETPDTWEVALSGLKDKKETFERMLKTNIDLKEKNLLGGLAFLRNLRNMEEAGVSKNLIREAASHTNFNRVLPFRFIAAAKYAPSFEDILEKAMLESLSKMEKLSGETVLLIDHSGSMAQAISQKSDISRFDAACALAIMAREICENVSIYTFEDTLGNKIPPRRGFALKDAITNNQGWGCTSLAGSLESLNKKEKYDRIIIFTDEQSHDGIIKPMKNTRGYIVNVASCENGVGYGNWTHVNGFSEAIINWIIEYEKEFNN